MDGLDQVTHEFEPVFDQNSKVLILGTFPSVKSRENQFYYGHPQNRFWKVIARLTKEQVPITIEEKKALLLRHGIAIWDVISSCEIKGSSDSSIRNVVPADLNRILDHCDIRRIYANGGQQRSCMRVIVKGTPADRSLVFPPQAPRMPRTPSTV